MKKTKKTTKSTKTPRQPSNARSKATKILLPIAIVFLVLAAVAGAVIYKYYPASKITKATNDATFCAGVDPTTNDDYVVRLSVNIKDQGHVRVFKTQKSPPTPMVMKYQDLVAAVEYQGPNGMIDRVNLRLGPDENLQVYRECGSKTICRLEMVHHLSPADLEKSKLVLKEFERDLAKAKMTLGKSTVVLKKAKKKSSKAVIAATAEVERSKLAVETLNQQIKRAKDLVNSQGTDMQTLDLTPTRAEEWCASAKN